MLRIVWNRGEGERERADASTPLNSSWSLGHICVGTFLSFFSSFFFFYDSFQRFSVSLPFLSVLMNKQCRDKNQPSISPPLLPEFLLWPSSCWNFYRLRGIIVPGGKRWLPKTRIGRQYSGIAGFSYYFSVSCYFVPASCYFLFYFYQMQKYPNVFIQTDEVSLYLDSASPVKRAFIQI